MERSVLVIGAGQAGLATGYHLRKAGLPFTIKDAGSNKQKRPGEPGLPSLLE